jgi:hypothetical protein
MATFASFATWIGPQEPGTVTPHLLSTGCYYDPERW